MWAFRGRGGIPAATHAPLRLSTASTPWSPHSARAHATSRSVTNAHTHSAAPASSSRACSSTSRSSSADQHAGRAEGQNQPGRHPPLDAAPHEGAQARCVDPDREPRHRGGQLQKEQQPTPEAHADERDDEGREATALIEDAGQAPQEDRLTTMSTTTSFSCRPCMAWLHSTTPSRTASASSRCVSTSPTSTHALVLGAAVGVHVQPQHALAAQLAGGPRPQPLAPTTGAGLPSRRHEYWTLRLSRAHPETGVAM